MDDHAAAGLEIELLPARHGDAILLTWGPADERHRLLVDGGPAIAYDDVSARLAQIAPTSALDLLVLTHVDADHIEGTILLTNDAGVGIGIGEVWFNGPDQLFDDELNAAQGEMFDALVKERQLPVNRAFDGHAVRVHDGLPLPTCRLHGLTLTVLGPDEPSLARLRDDWNPTLEDEHLNFESPEKALDALRRRKNLVPDDPYLAELESPDAAGVTELAAQPAPLDDSLPNASSIVVLAEYAGASVLLAGDATARQLTEGVRRLLAERHLDQLELTALKVPHHGSVRNVTRELLSLVPAEHYLFSTDGSYFGHPDAAGVARVLEYGRPGGELVFNYRSPQTLLWDDEALLGASTARYPQPETSGVRVTLSPNDRQEP